MEDFLNKNRWLLENKVVEVKRQSGQKVASFLEDFLSENPWLQPKYKTATLLVEKLVNAERMNVVDGESGDTVLHKLVQVERQESMAIWLHVLKDRTSRSDPMEGCLYIANGKNRTPLEVMLRQKEPKEDSILCLSGLILPQSLGNRRIYKFNKETKVFTKIDKPLYPEEGEPLLPTLAKRIVHLGIGKKVSTDAKVSIPILLLQRAEHDDNKHYRS